MLQLIRETTLTNIADAIRDKTGGTSPIPVADFATEIESISGGEPETGKFIIKADTDLPSDTSVAYIYNNAVYVITTTPKLKKLVGGSWEEQAEDFSGFVTSPGSGILASCVYDNYLYLLQGTSIYKVDLTTMTETLLTTVPFSGTPTAVSGHRTYSMAVGASDDIIVAYLVDSSGTTIYERYSGGSWATANNPGAYATDGLFYLDGYGYIAKTSNQYNSYILRSNGTWGTIAGSGTFGINNIAYLFPDYTRRRVQAVGSTTVCIGSVTPVSGAYAASCDYLGEVTYNNPYTIDYIRDSWAIDLYNRKTYQVRTVMSEEVA